MSANPRVKIQKFETSFSREGLFNGSTYVHKLYVDDKLKVYQLEWCLFFLASIRQYFCVLNFCSFLKCFHLPCSVSRCSFVSTYVSDVPGVLQSTHRLLFYFAF